MPLTQLIYTSRPFGFDANTLDDILLGARRNNERDGITGALVCRADLYVQMLEGERAAVTATFGRILRDERHVEVTLIWYGDTPSRLVPRLGHAGRPGADLDVGPDGGTAGRGAGGRGRGLSPAVRPGVAGAAGKDGVVRQLSRA